MRNSIIILLICLSGTSCALIDLSEIKITSFPENPEDILKAEEHIYLQFSEQVVRLSAESLFKLAGPQGICEGSFSWEENKMIFIPDAGMQPGFRYRLDFKGNLKSQDGRSFKKNTLLPFYYITDDLPPLLLESSPCDAENTGTKNPIELSFSKAIDKDIFEKEFKLSPSAETVFSWNDESTDVSIRPLKSWANLQYYRWTVPVTVTDTTAVPVPEAYTGSFLVQWDISPPALLSVHPAMDEGDGTFTILSDLVPDDLSINEHLALNFSEAVDYSSLNQCFSINPAIEGYLLSLSPDCALYYIDEILPPGQEYTLSLKIGLKDLSGNTSTGDREIIFTPAVPKLLVSSIVIEDQNGSYLSLSASDFGNSGFIDTPGLNYYDPGTLHFIVSLSEDYPDTSIERRAAFEELVSLSAVFPPGELAPTLFSSSWESPDHLRLIYNGLASFDPGEPVYYRFKISAGSFESATPIGSYLTGNVEFTFLAEARE